MQYTAYKDYLGANATWLGVYPNGWEERKLKFAVNLINEKLDAQQSDLEYMGLEHIESWTGKKIEDPTAQSEGVGARFIENDVLFGKLRPYLAKVYKAHNEGLVSTEALVLRADPKIDSDFLKYYLLSRDFINIVDGSTYGSKMPRANWEFIGNLSVLLPSKDEQEQIAKFLDHKTTQIDRLIEKKKALIEKLNEKRIAIITQAVTKGLDPTVPMRDSEVAWLGEVPEHWENWKVTHGFSRVGSGTTPKSDNPLYYEGETPWITTSELRESIIKDTKIKITQKALDDYSTLKVYKEGALAIAMYGATIGRLGILGIDATVNQACCIFSEPEKFDIKFFYYWLWMRRPTLIALSVGGGQPNLSQDDLKQLRVSIPTRQEQHEIADYLDAQCDQIDQFIEKVNSAIERLNEYRKALITDAATGKIDVRNVKIPEEA